MSHLPTVMMFSGQGSQYPGMARELFEQQPAFRKHLLEMDAQVSDRTGHSVISSLYAAQGIPGKSFERLLLTHPAIFMVELALARALIDRNGEPDCVLGASMGTLAAAVVAGCIDASCALDVLLMQARVIEERCQRGAMIAVLGDQSLYGELLADTCELAGINLQSHFVVSTRQPDFVEAVLRDRGVACKRLAVEYAFHSRWIDEAAAPFRAYLARIALRPPRIPVMCCVEGNVRTRLMSDYFWAAVREPMRLKLTIERMESLNSHRYIDVGPGGSMATLVKYAVRSGSGSETAFVLSAFGRDMSRFESLVARRSWIAPAPPLTPVPIAVT